MRLLYHSLLITVCYVVLLAPLGRADIMLNLENPASDQQVSGIGLISGWAFSTTPGVQVTVRLRIDGQTGDPIPCCVNRLDVAQDPQFSSFPQALNSGFAQVFNFNLLSGDSHKIAVEVSDGSTTTIEEPKSTDKHYPNCK
jgi:hypothetical protein